MKLIWINLLLIQHCLGYRFKLDSVTNSSGAYYENIGYTKFHSSNWKLITFLNMSIYYEKLGLLESIYSKSVIFCEGNTNESSTFYCKQSLSLIQVQLPSISTKLESLQNLIGHTRQRRGWFNAVGTMFKTIFGTLDANDAEFYENAINQVTKDESTLMNLMQDQIHVVKTTIANFNETISKLKINEHLLNNNINKFNKYSEMVSNELTTLRINELRTQHISLLTYLANELNEELDNIINSILFAKKNILHPTIISPIQLVTELNANIQLLPKGLNFPVPCNLENSHILLSITDLQVFYKNNKIIFIINIPLSEDRHFSLYRLYPLPTPHQGSTNSYAYIQPSIQILAISNNHLSYAMIHDFAKCKLLTQEHYLCKNNVIYPLNQKSVCEVRLFIHGTKRIPSDCNTKLLVGEIEIIHPLKFNQWITVNSKPTSLTILCDDNEQIIDQTIVGTNILSLNNSCEAYINTNRLIPSYIISTEFHPVIPSPSIIEDDCCVKEKLNITHEYLHLSPVSLNNINLDGLRLVSHNLDKISDKIKEAEHHPNLIKYPSAYSILIYVTTTTLTLLILFKIFMCIRHSKRSSFSSDSCLVRVTNTFCSDVRSDSHSMPNLNTDHTITSIQEREHNVPKRKPVKMSAASLPDIDFNLSN